MTPVERDLVTKFVLEQDEGISPVQERAMARMLRRSPEVVKELIADARVTFASHAPRYVEIHQLATEAALASGTVRGFDTALRASQWAMERIAAEGSRVIDKPNTDGGGGPRIVIGIRVGCLSVGGTDSPATTIDLAAPLSEDSDKS